MDAYINEQKSGQGSNMESFTVRPKEEVSKGSAVRLHRGRARRNVNREFQPLLIYERKRSRSDGMYSRMSMLVTSHKFSLHIGQLRDTF